MGDVSAATTFSLGGFFYLITTMENNYSVYQHVTPDGMYYFGQTQNVERRWRNNGAEYKGTALQPYIEKFGWENIQHIVLFKDQTRENALWIEDFLITTAQEDGVCINQRRSGLVSKEEGYSQEYYEKNKGQVQERQKQYYEKNKDKKQQYYQKNREKRLEQRRQRYQKNREKELEYYQKNREKILEYQRQRYQKNREKELEQRRQRYQKNREKLNEYQRKYYQHKKLEKELKEVETITLF